MPKMLDLAAVYGPANPDLTRQLLQQVFDLQPAYASDVQASVGPLVAHLHTLQESTLAAARNALRAGGGGGGAGAGGSANTGSSVVTSLLDATAFLRDTVATLLAFVACCPPASAHLMAPGPGSLLAALASLHDHLLPSLGQALTRSNQREAARQLGQVGGALQALAFQVVANAYLRAGASGKGAQQVGGWVGGLSSWGSAGWWWAVVAGWGAAVMLGQGGVWMQVVVAVWVAVVLVGAFSGALNGTQEGIRRAHPTGPQQLKHLLHTPLASAGQQERRAAWQRPHVSAHDRRPPVCTRGGRRCGRQHGTRRAAAACRQRTLRAGCGGGGGDA